MPRSDQSMDLTCPRVSLMPGYSYCKGGKLNLGWYLLCSRIYSILIITKCLEQMEIAFWNIWVPETQRAWYCFHSIYPLFAPVGAMLNSTSEENSIRNPFISLTYSPCSDQVLFFLTLIATRFVGSLLDYTTSACAPDKLVSNLSNMPARSAPLLTTVLN